MSGPGAGLSKWFFFPGFTAGTGGLLRETDLLARRQAWDTDPALRGAWLQGQGIAPPRPGERLVSLFCYEQAPVAALLDALAASEHPTRVLATPGHAQTLAKAWQACAGSPGALTLHHLDHIEQRDFDHLLWACDLNFVRGEDSAVRALWAGQPHVWHIYPQDDGVHEGKLDAFMDRWMAAWPDDLARGVRPLWRAWNGLAGGASAIDHALLNRLLDDPRWAAHSRSARQALAEIPDLVTQLCGFVLDKR